MEKVELLISCQSAGYVKIDDNKSFFCDNNSAQKLVKVTFNDYFLIYVTPANDNKNTKHLSYIAKMHFDNHSLTTSSPYVVIIKHSNSQYEIVLLDNTFIILGTTYNEFELSNKSKLILTDNKVSIKSLKNEYTSYTNFIMYNPQIKEIGNNIIIIDKNNNKYNLAIFDNKLNHAQCYNKINTYNIKENNLIIASNINDYTHHVLVTKLNLENEIKIDEEYTAYLSSPKISTNTKIIPYTFLQNIKYKDYTLAKKYLSEKLLEKIKIEHLSGFFDNFIQISTPKFSNSKNIICLIYKQNERCFYTKKFNFEFENNLIVNITEVNTI